MRIALGCGLLVLLGTLGCSSGDDAANKDGASSGFQIGSGTLSGKIGGAPWTFVAGETDSFLSDEKSFFAELYADTIPTACQNGPSSGKNSLILNVPPQAGDYGLSLSLNATFVIDATQENLGATRGRLRVDEVTDTSIRGGAHIVFDAANEVDGVFQLSVCP
jgi:hypothetical protein